MKKIVLFLFLGLQCLAVGAQSYLKMIVPTREALSKSDVVLVVSVKDKNMVPKYRRIAGKPTLVSSEVFINGSVKEVLWGKYSQKTFKGLFNWENLELPREVPKEKSKKNKKDKLTLESGDESTLESGEDWVVFFKEGPKNSKRINFFRAEGARVRGEIVSQLCSSKKKRLNLSKTLQEECKTIKANK